MKNRYSLAEIKASLTKKKNSRSSLWVQLWVRKASFPVTWLFINTGWSANKVSVLSWVQIFVAAVLLSIDSFGCRLAGVILTNLWLVLDCVDGNIARVKKTKNYMGDFFDAVAGYGPFSFTTIGLGVAAFHTTRIFSQGSEFLLMLLAGIAATANLYTRLIHQKYMNCLFAAKKDLGELEQITLKDTEDKRSFSYIREQIDKNLGVAGLFMPWLFVALFTNSFDIMLLVYSLYYLLSFAAVSVLYCMKATAFEKEARSRRDNMYGRDD